MKIRTEQEMLAYGRKLGEEFLSVLAGGNTVVLELLGDVGAGKTTLTRGIAQGLGIKTAITSPSFTISKRYAFPLPAPSISIPKQGGETDSANVSETTTIAGMTGTLAHYDFYRIPDPGLMLDELSECISTPSTLVILEWADSVAGILPEHHKKIQIDYLEDGGRELIEL